MNIHPSFLGSLFLKTFDFCQFQIVSSRLATTVQPRANPEQVHDNKHLALLITELEPSQELAKQIVVQAV